MLDDQFLSLGYAVASSTLNVLDNNCSTIISAEAAMMVKEHFIDTYGPLQFTIGWGGSGGAIQQYEIADSYPGILNGIIPSISFPDPLTTAGPVTDCRLIDSFFAGRRIVVHDRAEDRDRRLQRLHDVPVVGCHLREPVDRHRQL